MTSPAGGTKDFKGEFSGHSTKINDEFIVRFGKCVHYSRQKLVEVVPDKKIVLAGGPTVRSNGLKRIRRNGRVRKMIFELVPKGDKAILHFTHEGLMPGKECYEKCVQGWDMLIRDKLFRLLSTQTQKDLKEAQNSKRSCASIAGCSRAAKCPPAGMLVHCWILYPRSI